MGFFGVKIFFFALGRSGNFFSRQACYIFFLQKQFFKGIKCRQKFFSQKNHSPPLQVKWMFPKKAFVES